MANPGRRVRSTEILNILLEKADIQGYLTTEDLMEFYPDVSKDAERIESTMVLLRRHGVEILDILLRMIYPCLNLTWIVFQILKISLPTTLLDCI